jgi:hypothetical protein
MGHIWSTQCTTQGTWGWFQGQWLIQVFRQDWAL